MMRKVCQILIRKMGGRFGDNPCFVRICEICRQGLAQPKSVLCLRDKEFSFVYQGGKNA